MKISLERKEDDKSMDKPMDVCCERPKYPTLYISEVEGIDGLEMGQEVTLKARVSMTKETETKDSERCEVELEVLELASTGKMAPSPSGDKEDSEEVDKGLDEAISKSKSKKKEDDNASETE